MKSKNLDYISEQRSLPRDSVESLNVEHRVKGCICLVWLDTRTSQPARNFLVLWARGVDAGTVKGVILLFISFSKCRNHLIGQSWGVFIHRNRKWLSGSEDRRGRLESTKQFLNSPEHSPEGHGYLVNLETLGGDYWSYHAGCCRPHFKCFLQGFLYLLSS